MFNAPRNALAVTLLATLMISNACRGKPNEELEFFRSYLTKLKAGDVEELAKCYYDKVLILKGSTLLKRPYGDLGGDDAASKSKHVERSRLMAAYAKAMVVFDGFDVTIKDFKEENIKIVTAEDDNVPSGIKKGDAVVIANPSSDRSFYVMRKLDGIGWRIVAEQWD